MDATNSPALLSAPLQFRCLIPHLGQQGWGHRVDDSTIAVELDAEPGRTDWWSDSQVEAVAS